jgi:hypothetical protein
MNIVSDTPKSTGIFALDVPACDSIRCLSYSRNKKHRSIDSLKPLLRFARLIGRDYSSGMRLQRWEQLNTFRIR